MYHPNFTKQTPSNCVTYAICDIVNSMNIQRNRLKRLEYKQISDLLRKELNAPVGAINGHDALEILSSEKYNIIKGYVPLEHDGEEIILKEVRTFIKHRPLFLIINTFYNKDERIDEHKVYKQPRKKIFGSHAVVIADDDKERACLVIDDSNYNEYVYLPYSHLNPMKRVVKALYMLGI